MIIISKVSNIKIESVIPNIKPILDDKILKYCGYTIKDGKLMDTYYESDPNKKRIFKPYYNFCENHGYTRFNKKLNRCMKCLASDRRIRRLYYIIK